MLSIARADRTGSIFVPQVVRTPLRDVTIRRVLRGGRVTDAGRLPRYFGFWLLGAASIWAPISGYLATAPERFTSHVALILPGAGASASVNLSDIGQASSFSSSPFASNSVSPTATYKRLLASDRVVRDAAKRSGMGKSTFGEPRVETVDQTGLIRIQIAGDSPEDAQARGAALLASFQAALHALRMDELGARQSGSYDAITEYRASVARTRSEIDSLQRGSGLITAQQYDALVVGADALARKLADLDAALERDSQAVARLEAALGVTPDVAAATLRLQADGVFRAQIDDMSREAAALTAAESRFGAEHPQVRDARGRYAAARDSALARASLLTALDSAVLDTVDLSPSGERAALLARLVETDSARRGLVAERDALAGQLAADRARIADLLATAARLEDLKRDFQVAEAVFASAIARSESTKSDLYASYPLVQVLEPPSLPERPSSPRRGLAIGAGIAATIMLIIALSLAWARQPLIDRLIVRQDPDAQA